jgi:hypothetical protein
LRAWDAGFFFCSYRDVPPAIAGCDRIRKALGCSVVIVAHVGLSEKAQDRPKGLSDLPGAVDGGTKCAKTGDGRAAVFTFSAAMQRYAADEYEFTAKMDGDGPETTALRYLSKRETAKATLDPDATKMLDILRVLGDGASVDQWRDAVLIADIWRVKQGPRKGEQVANPRDRWTRELEKLVRGGWVEVNGTMAQLSDEDKPAADDGAGAEFDEE